MAGYAHPTLLANHPDLDGVWSLPIVVADDACRSQGADLAEKFKRDRSAVKFIGVPPVHKISFDWAHAIWIWVARNATMPPIRFMAQYLGLCPSTYGPVPSRNGTAENRTRIHA